MFTISSEIVGRLHVRLACGKLIIKLVHLVVVSQNPVSFERLSLHLIRA